MIKSFIADDAITWGIGFAHPLAIIMSNRFILLCSQDPLFIKATYAPLRDYGYEIDIIEHPSEAVRCVINKNYLSVILDSRDFGINAMDALNIIKSIQPDIKAIVVGTKRNEFDIETIDSSVAVDHLKDLFKGLMPEKTIERRVLQ